MGPVNSTSRSGRLADTRPEVMMIMDQLQQICSHTRWRVDGSDSGSLNDVFAAIQKVECENPMLSSSPDKFSKTEVEWLERIKTDLEETIKDLKAKKKIEYTKEN